MIPNDKTYHSIVAIFNERGFGRMENLTQLTVENILNQVMNKNLKRPFKKQLLQEIIDECIERHYGQLSPHNLGIVIVHAKDIISQRMSLLEGPKGFMKDREEILKQKRLQLEIDEDSPSKRQTQLYQKLQKDIESIQKQLKGFEKDQKVFREELTYLQNIYEPQKTKTHRSHFQESESDHSEDTVIFQNNLSIVFYCALACLTCQLLISLQRPSFATVLVLLHTFYLIFLGYNSRKTVMYLIVELFCNIVMDIFFLFVVWYMSLQFPMIRYSEIQILRTVERIMLVISILLRIVMIVKVYPYKEPKIIKTYFYLCGTILELNRRSHTRFSKI